MVMHYHTGPITDPYNEIQLQHDFVRELKWFIVQKDEKNIFAPEWYTPGYWLYC